MCGVFGFVATTPRETNAGWLATVLGHRGPDGHGIRSVTCHGRHVTLAHTRLAILDLSSAGAQPMASGDGRWWISFNGEIYNHQDLRKLLQGPFKGHSDTETLVELLASFGVEKALPLLNGMFAFAALDTETGTLHLVRDPFGIKPLYVTRDPSVGIAFSSEVRALHEWRGTPFDVSPDGLQTFLTLRYVPSPQTLWTGVDRVPPGHVLSIRLSNLHLTSRCFVTPTSERFDGTLDDACEQYLAVLGAAVNRQLLSDVPVGLLLSGGIDSALVACMAKRAGQALHAFTVGFGAAHEECEIDAARETAQILSLPFHSVRVGPDDLRDAIYKVVASIEEPLGTTSVLPMWYLTQHAHQHVKVVLTGQGSDEPLGGYRRYQLEVLRARLPLPGILAPLAALVRHVPGVPSFVERGLRSVAVADETERFEQVYTLFTAKQRSALTGRADGGVAAAAITGWLSRVGSEGRTSVDRMMAIDTRMNLADDLLLYGDKIAMAHSLEARVPMLDVDVVRFLESLPTPYRVRVGKTKIIHKRFAEAYLPPSIVHRPKKGFQVPFDAWSRGAWKDWVGSLLLDPGAPALQWLHRPAIQALWSDHQAGKPGLGRQIFALLMFAIWADQQHPGQRA